MSMTRSRKARLYWSCQVRQGSACADWRERRQSAAARQKPHADAAGAPACCSRRCRRRPQLVPADSQARGARSGRRAAPSWRGSAAARRRAARGPASHPARPGARCLGYKGAQARWSQVQAERRDTCPFERAGGSPRPRQDAAALWVAGGRGGVPKPCCEPKVGRCQRGGRSRAGGGRRGGCGCGGGCSRGCMPGQPAQPQQARTRALHSCACSTRILPFLMPPHWCCLCHHAELTLSSQHL